jgi:VCBS repeat protein/FG-GAP repeat protein
MPSCTRRTARGSRRAFFAPWGGAAWLAAALVGMALLPLGRSTSPSIEASESQSGATLATQGDEHQARAVCGGCHTFPPPEILPRQVWRDEFVRMMFIREKRLPPLGPSSAVQLPPDMQQVLPFYTRHAPDRFPPIEPWPDASDKPVQFVQRSLTLPGLSGTPAVSNVQLVDFDGDKRLDVLATEMRQGLVFAGQPGDAGKLTVVASIPHPAHVTWADVDRDGVQDLLVADLGELFPADHDRGAAIWLRGLGAGKFGAFWVDGWPRVADVETADFNGDGKNDLAVAAFGWRNTGRISILENRTTNASQPMFTNHTIDPRPGSIHIIPIDLNHDGKMDFVTLLAQEHETVLAYINKGTGDFSFDQKVIYAAPHPNWGSSGIQLADLDRDGDLDVLLTHGDSFDDGIVKPYHGIQWLENTGGYPFVEHPLAQMPGVHRAEAADLDGDGDLDVVACALLAGGSDVDEKTLPALVWLEQTKPGTFARHTIEMGTPRYATLDVGDIDGDGDIDIVVGNFSFDKPAKTLGLIDVWTNQLKNH